MIFTPRPRPYSPHSRMPSINLSSGSSWLFRLQRSSDSSNIDHGPDSPAVNQGFQSLNGPFAGQPSSACVSQSFASANTWPVEITGNSRPYSLSSDFISERFTWLESSNIKFNSVVFHLGELCGCFSPVHPGRRRRRKAELFPRQLLIPISSLFQAGI